MKGLKSSFALGHNPKGATIMPTRKSTSAVIFVIILTLCLGSCSDDEKGTTDPGSTVVSMNGTLEFPDTTGIDFSEISVTFGDAEQSADSTGAFAISGNRNIPGLAGAFAQDTIPLLLGIVPDPQQGMQLPLTVRSTALAVVYMTPGICVGGNAEQANDILTWLNNLLQLDTLATLLEQKLSANSEVLGSADQEISTAIDHAVSAFFTSFPAQTAKTRAVSRLAQANNGDGIYISPTTQTSGHSLTHASENTYQITNAYGRYAICVVHQTGEKFILVPNGGMFDFFIDGLPWAPSKATFVMPVAADGDSALVDVFGYGLENAPGSYWNDLTTEERLLAHQAGFLTIILEFGGGMVDLVGNANALGNLHGKYVALDKSYQVVDFLLSDMTFLANVELYLRQGEYSKLSWEVITKFVKKLVSDPQYLQIWGEFTGKFLSDAAVEKLKGTFLAPALAISSGFAIGNKMNQVFNTEAGLLKARFKTRFRVWKDVEEFGSVSGQVADETSGVGIQGASVHISGDINNPLDPAHDATTDAGGYYSFSNIGIGEKTITASKSGYKTKTVDVTIEEGKTATVDITLEQESGGLGGKVLNDIYIQNSHTPQTFQGTVEMTARQIGGDHEVITFSASNGVYNKSLPPGQWWIIAAHQDYDSDSIQVSVPVDGTVTASRDLVLKPITSLAGTMYLDLNADGGYESSYVVDFSQIGMSIITNQDNCPYGGNPMPMLAIGAIRGSNSSDYDLMVIGLNTTLITGPGAWNVAGYDYFGCSGFGVAATAAFQTTRAHCLYGTQYEPLTFTYMGDPESAGCNCGITAPGNLYATEWGTELADVVAASFVIDLAGWKGCTCYGDDTDNDGINDTWDVDCAKVQLNLNFRVHVGTEYKLTWVPNGKPAPISIRKIIRERLITETETR
jgi:hypothetical protein